MNERMNESLSALVDGEADELEIRRLLNYSEQNDALRDTWNRYQMISSIMRGQAASGIDLSKGIRQAIDGEPMDNIPTISFIQTTHSSTLWKKMAVSGAVAASVMAAVIIGFQPQQTMDVNADMIADQRFESTLPVVEVASMSTEQQAQLEEAQRKLQEYVLQHNEHATEGPARSMLPFARTVNFQQGEITTP